MNRRRSIGPLPVRSYTSHWIRFPNTISSGRNVRLSLRRGSKTIDRVRFAGVLGYLNADDLIVLLRKLKLTLKKNGVIVIKDNCVENGQETEFDPDDQYYIRSKEQFYDIAHRSGFLIRKDLRSKLKQVVRELLPIRIFVLTMK